MNIFQWLNLCFDMVSLVGETWRGQTFKALESISISANCRLRKIFTMKIQPPDTVGDDGKYQFLVSMSHCKIGMEAHDA